MYTLSVANPWSWAIMHGLKRIENRSWKTKYRGRLWIHSSKSKSHLHTDKWPPGIAAPNEAEFSFGALVGTVILLDCVPFADVQHDPFALGPWCWLLGDARPLVAPIPWKGNTGLFRVPEDIEAP